MKDLILKPTLVVLALVAALGLGTLEAVKAARIRNRIQSLQQQQPLDADLQQQCGQLEDLNAKLIAARQERQQLQSERAELPALRGEVTRLRKDSDELAALKAAAARVGVAPDDWRLPRLNQLQRSLEQMPESNIPELRLFNDLDWLGIAQSDLIKLRTDDEVRESLCIVRTMAKFRFVRLLAEALAGFTNAIPGQLPAELSQLQPYFAAPMDEAILRRYAMVNSGSTADARSDKFWVTERAPVDEDHDHVLQIKADGSVHYLNFSAAERERQALLKLAHPPSPDSDAQPRP